MKKKFFISLIFYAMNMNIVTQAMDIAQAINIAHFFGDVEEKSIFEQKIRTALGTLKKTPALVSQHNDEHKKSEHFTNITLNKLDDAMFNYTISHADKNVPLSDDDFNNLIVICHDLLKVNKDYIQYFEEHIAVALTVLALNTIPSNVFYKNEIIKMSETLQKPGQHKRLLSLLSASFDQRYADNKDNLLAIDSNNNQIELHSKSIGKLDQSVAVNDKAQKELCDNLAKLKKENNSLQQQRVLLQNSVNNKKMQNNCLRNENDHSKQILQNELSQNRADIEELYRQRKDVNISIQAVELLIVNLELLIKSNPANTEFREQKSQNIKDLAALKLKRINLDSIISNDEKTFDHKSTMVHKSTQNGTLYGSLKRGWFASK